MGQVSQDKGAMRAQLRNLLSGNSAEHSEGVRGRSTRPNSTGPKNNGLLIKTSEPGEGYLPGSCSLGEPQKHPLPPNNASSCNCSWLLTRHSH